MEYTFDNIGEWVEDLVKRPKIFQFQTYARLMRDREQQKAKRVILDKFEKDRFGYHAKDIWIINDDMAIILYDYSQSRQYFVPIVHGEPQNYSFTTFEGALLAALSLLKTGDVDAAKYAGKILEVEM